MDKNQVFISYAKEDKEIARKIYSDLRNIGVRVWLDEEDLLPGQKWKLAIREAIEDSSFFLALLSNHSLSKTGYVQNEMKIALEIAQEYPSNEIFILPIRVEDCTPSDRFLQDLHWCDLFGDYERGIEQVRRVIFPLNNLSFDTLDNGIPKHMSKRGGAWNGESLVESIFEEDSTVCFNGQPSFKLSGDINTHRWNFFSYRIPRYVKALKAEFAVKTENVRKEDNQYNNCYVGFVYRDENDEQRFHIAQFNGTNDWKVNQLFFNVQEQKAHNVEFSIFLSKSGTMWVSSIKLTET